MRVSFYVPRPSSMLVSNLLGVAGLLFVVVAIGLLAGWPWALLATGLLLVGLCAVAQNAGAVSASQPAGASAAVVVPEGPPELKAVS